MTPAYTATQKRVVIEWKERAEFEIMIPRDTS